MPTITLAILNKNDGPSLRKLIPEIDLSLFDQVIAIDGLSTDDSLEVLKDYGITTISIGGGRGGAFSYAVNKATTDYIIFFSSDGEEDPSDLGKMKKLLFEGTDLVIASRVSGNNSGFKSDHNLLYIHRKLYLFFISRSISLLFGGKIKDCWNGYRGMNVAKAKALNLDASNFLIEAQTTIRFLASKHNVIEFPTVERPRFFGASQNPIFTSGMGHITLLIKEYARKFRSTNH